MLTAYITYFMLFFKHDFLFGKIVFNYLQVNYYFYDIVVYWPEIYQILLYELQYFLLEWYQ